jgi:hypothetical protein
MFTAYDTNNDGKVCEKEYVNGRRAERDFAAKDTDGDGNLNFREWLGKGWHKGCRVMGGLGGKLSGCMNPFDYGWRNFLRQDRNNDGKLTAAEYVTAETRPQPIFSTKPWMMHTAK